MDKYKNYLISLLLSTGLLISTVSEASNCEPWVAMAISVQGNAELRIVKGEKPSWQAIKLGDTFCTKDVLRVRENSRVALILNNDTVVRLDQNTTITFSSLSPDKDSTLDLKAGIAHFISRVKQAFKVITPFVNAAIEGTEFVVKVEPEQAEVTVFEGIVRAENDKGQLRLTQGQTAVALKDQAPVLKTLVKPRNAVQWALYYPTILRESEINPKLPDEARDKLAQSMMLNARGKASDGLNVLVDLPGDLQDANVYAYRASLSLSVGRVDEATQDIEQALSIDTNNSNAIALKSIIAVVDNRASDAVQLAQQAVDADANNAAAYLALSYARQAQFDLTAALQAIDKAPEDLLITSRRAALYLMQGELDAAMKTVHKAVSKNPDSSHTQTILGYAYLIKVDTENATKAFTDAINLEQTNPLAHLGLGLALIRKGQLAQGRRQIEYAASLDPNNSLIRSYLGKAYYEENRNSVAADQFDMAKKLDPNDPTPWFYDAIRKQSDNDPVNAMKDINTSVALNDNRQVYRSQLLLDEDLAGRNVGQAQIFKELGFQHQARTLASASITQSPGNYAAHKFLADINATLPGHGIAQASELLQAQLLQPINPTPVRPQLAEADLAIFGTTSLLASSFNEYSSLFHKDGVYSVLNAQAGTNETYSDDLIISGANKKFSYSIGQSFYTTDGYRDNNDNREEIQNLFLQYAFNHKINMQFEIRNRETDQGDIDQNFDLTSFSTSDRRVIDHYTRRIGVHIAPSPSSDFLFSFIQSDRDEHVQLFEGGVDINVSDDRDGYQGEIQYLANYDDYNIVAGLGSYDVNIDKLSTLDWTLIFTVPCPAFPPVDCFVIEDYSALHNTAYLYINIPTSNNKLLWTIGASHDALEKRSQEINETNPKFGLQWQVTESLRLRLAHFETVKRELIVEQTIEPTQVAGFNQFYDNWNGSKEETSAIGIDGIINGNTTFNYGIELIKRVIDKAQFETTGFSFQDKEIVNSKIYFDILFSNNFAISISAEREDTENSDPADPYNIDTLIAPVKFKYFTGKKFFTELSVTSVEQKRILTSGAIEESDDVTLADLSIGYRLPKRKGTIGLDIFNISDEQFSYQDNNYAISSPVRPRFIPERTVLARFAFHFD